MGGFEWIIWQINKNYTFYEINAENIIMIADCHTHMNCTAGQANIADHLSACEQIDSCIVLATAGESTEKSNKDLSDYIKDQPKMVGFGIFDPLRDNPAPKNVKSLTIDMGLKGVVLYCPQGGFHPADSRIMRFYKAAEGLKLPVFFHNCPPFAGDDILNFSQPYLIDEVARKFGDLKMIIGGMGLPFLNQTISMLAKHENVYADLSICPQHVWEVYNLVVNCYEAGIMDKLLFGSGYPQAQPGECIETLLGFNKLMANTGLPNVPREEIRAIIERDTLSVLGIDL
jgi:predicted TIM-barrel fold metal-dependent hydrolase